MTEILKNIRFFVVNPQLAVVYFFYSLVLVGMQEMIFFPSNLTTVSANLLHLVYQFYLPFIRSVADGYCFYMAMSVRLDGNNSQINHIFLRILTVLELSLNHEFYSRLPGLTDVYNNDKKAFYIL